MNTDIPHVPAIDELMEDPNADEDLIPRDTRRVTRLLDAVIQPDGTLSDSEDEGEGGRRNHATNRDVDTEAAEDFTSTQAVTSPPLTAEEKETTPETTNDEEMKPAEPEETQAESEAKPDAVTEEGPKETVLKANTVPAATGIMNPGSTGGGGPSASASVVMHEAEAPMEVDEPSKKAKSPTPPAKEDHSSSASIMNPH
jgi:hypothetical protein